MNLTLKIEELQQLKSNSNDAGHRKYLDRIIDLLNEVESKELSARQRSGIEKNAESLFAEVETKKQAKKSLNRFREFLAKEYSFIPANYFTSLGIGLGLLFGNALGISLGTAIDMESGLALGIGIGSGMGLTAGILIGRYLDQQRQSNNQVLHNL